jgi:23S rRNA pseudouridine2604 synthase
VRINKYVAEKFAITRREADKFIEDGFVHIESVNPGKDVSARTTGKSVGRKTTGDKTITGATKTSRRRHAKLGDRIDPKTETVILNQKKVVDHKSKYMYFVYNKPIGIVTHSPTGDELDIKGLLLKESSIAPHITKDLFPIGRLDKKSQGLILLTNDGRMSDLMLNPAYEHEKEYVVTTVQDLPSYFKKSMEKGVNIGDYVTKPCKIELRGPKTFAITITEGKKHQIRRMCEAMKTDVRTLERTRIMNIRLGSLRSNDLKKIEGRELDLFLKQLVH